MIDSSKNIPTTASGRIRKRRFDRLCKPGHMDPLSATTDKSLSCSAPHAAGCGPEPARVRTDASVRSLRVLPAARHTLIVAALIGFILWLAFLPGLVALVKAEEEQPIVVTKKQLKTAAYNSLWRLKRSIERDGYYGNRVALNVWRSNAIDAGIFKQEEYDQYKQQIFEKSIASNQRCFERAVEGLNYTDANKCLLTWKMHSEEIGRFDADRYEEMQTLLESIKNQKPQESES